MEKNHTYYVEEEERKTEGEEEKTGVEDGEVEEEEAREGESEGEGEEVEKREVEGQEDKDQERVILLPLYP